MTVRVKVIPRSAQNQVIGEMPDGTLKVRIAAAPERGKANDELIALLARHFQVARSAVTIISGHSTGLKLISIDT
jgi:uncharacterized protein (TIGR00251 family)